MIKCKWRWLRQQAFAVAIVTALLTGSGVAENKMLLLLNDVGEIIKIDLDKGKVLEKTYISDTYYANRIIADPKGGFVLVGGGAQLALFLDPKSLNIRNGLRQ